jgi:hypothetical protein
MPLVKSPSDKALRENIRREREAGRDPMQAAAIAYSNQRREENRQNASKHTKASRRVNARRGR